MENIIRLLKAEEIECRVATVNENGLSLLLYKDARVDQRILDESFGLFGWKRSHQCIDGKLYCTVEILNKETGEWVAKQDVGTVSYSEKEKGQASDSFKRACFNWGIGRELYTAPFIWIPASKVTIQKKVDKFYCKENFVVQKIDYNTEKEIVGLKIATDKGTVVYELKAKKQVVKKGISDSQLLIFDAELERTGVELSAVQERYHFAEPEQMSLEIYDKVMQALAKTKTAKAA